MNLQQLIELAVLDAMGLLDESEQGQFEIAFRTAPPQVQAQVRREQTRLSVMEALLPDVSPPAGLRAAVLDAVRRNALAAESELPPMIRSRNVSRFWRAAALGLAAAAVVMGVGMFEIYGRFNDLQLRIADDEGRRMLVERFGGNYVHDVLFSKDTRRVVFSPKAAGSKSQVSAFFNPEWQEAKLFHFGLGDAEGRKYKLALVDDQNNIVSVLKTFTPTGGMDGITFVLGQPSAKSHLAVLTTNSSGNDEVIETGDLPAPTL